MAGCRVGNSSMVIKLQCQFQGIADGEIFNKLAIWCFNYHVRFAHELVGTTMRIDMEGDDMVLVRMRGYLEAKRHGI